MSQKIRIWTLNRATDLIQGHEDEIIQIFKDQDLTCRFGHRENAHGTSKVRHQLMYEGQGEEKTSLWGNLVQVFQNAMGNGMTPASPASKADVDEYFVPIPLKCIGSKAWTANPPREGDPTSEPDILAGIVSQYPYLQDREKFAAFWSSESDPTTAALKELKQLDDIVSEAFGRVRMNTKNDQGYYELLEQYEGEQHILIGYSQGGLVARYLAFLDEHVFKKNIIAGVITVASPNYGSPLANPTNRNDIAQGVIQIAEVAQDSPFVKLLRFLDSSVDDILKQLVSGRFEGDSSYKHLYQFIQDQYRERMEKLQPEKRSKDNLASLLKTAIKWLSGMQNYSFSAFDELDIQNYDKAYSVLELVNKPEYSLTSTYTGAVLTGNNTTAGLITSLLTSPNSWASRFSWLTKPLFNGIIRMGTPLSKRIQEYDRLYREEIMIEQSPLPKASIVKTLKNDYHQGRTVKSEGTNTLEIPTLAHDFVIPTAYQILPDTGSNLLGHRINLGANHNNGKELTSKPGQKNWMDIRELLILMADKLAEEA